MTTARWVIGGGIAAALVAGGLYASKAYAADLKGDCGCADLEERVAELEASTVRKGNRKFKLTISGVVHKGILHHNNDDLPGDGKASIYDGTTDPTRVRFAGEAKTGKDWAAGFVVEIAWAGNTARGTDVGKALLAIDGPDGKNEFQIGETGQTIRHSFVYLDGPVGKVSIGQQSTATDGVIEVNLSQSNVASRALQTMPMNFGGAVSGLNIPFDGTRAQALRYDTPTLMGFTGAVAWQDNDSWDAALRFAQEFGQIRVAAAIGHRDQKSQTLANIVNLLDVVTLNLSGAHKSTAGSLSIMHTPTGIFANVYASQVKYDLSLDVAILPPIFTASFAIGNETVKGIGGQVGVERNWFGVGATTLFGLYEKQDGQVLFNDMQTYGLGAVQQVDSLATQIYLSLKRHDVTPSPLCVGLCKDTDVISGGVKVSF